MKLLDGGLLDQIFSVNYTDDATGTTRMRHFNASALHRELLANPLPMSQVEVRPDWARYIFHNRGCKQDGVTRQMGRLITGDQHQPLLYLCTADGTHLQIDGHHKYVAAAALGVPHLWAVFVPLGSWEWCEVEDFPDELTPDLRAVEDVQPADPIHRRDRTQGRP